MITLEKLIRIFIKKKPPKGWNDPNTCLTVYMQKRHPMRFDMRYKNTRLFIEQSSNTPFWYFMQSIANKLGAKDHGFAGSGTRWELWLNPFWQFKQWKFRNFDIKKPIHFG